MQTCKSSSQAKLELEPLILTKYLQGAEGKTAYERLFGKAGVWVGREWRTLPPSGVSWQPCRRVQSHPARATG